ncbi:MAG TPA: PSD1 and planctomycete cytochrome C domain-containing protein [Planctomycetota bacterium]|nr:PSD1 and planctomycete cytochrome C domain-containing protein [Planctomycetota bacterium]
MTRHYLLPLLCVTLAAAHAGDAPPKVPADHAQQMSKGLEIFKNSVRGIFITHCLKCHGDGKTKGDLDINTREDLLKGGAEGPAIVVGKSKESLLYKLITHADEPYMPEKKPKLADADIASIAAWIDAGAPYDKPLLDKPGVPKARAVVTDEDRKFWSFQPLSRQSPPAVQNKAWCKTPVDQFILAKLEEKKIAPNPPAERRKLIRRAYLDVIGLPPTPEEVEAFVKDNSSDAYAKLVDKLLDNPHYGERWGRHWLDLARFGESHGYEQDYDRPHAYHYRDFVIKALNQDMPYDRFVKLQIAGDEMEPNNPLAMMATGFLGAGTHATQITANQAEKERYDELDDKAATIGTAMLGMTIGCARCHDHKFDPIPTKDYYRLISTFTTTVRSDMPIEIDPEKNKAAKEAFDREHRPLVDALESYEKGTQPARFEEWLNTNPEPPKPHWLTLEFASAKANSQSGFTRQEDGSYIVSGLNPDKDVYTITANVGSEKITSIKLEALADKGLTKGGPGRSDNGNIALTDFKVTAAPLDGKAPAVPLKLVNPKATFEQKGLPVAATIDNDPKSGWAVDPQFGKDHAAVYELETPAGFEGGTVLTFVLKFEHQSPKHSIGRPRLSISTQPNPAPLGGNKLPQKTIQDISDALKLPADKRGQKHKDALLTYFKSIDPEWQKLNSAVQEHLKKAPQPELTKVMVCSEGVPAIRLHTQGPDFYPKTYYLKRGDLNQKQGEAEPGFLQALMRAPEQDKKWIVAPPKGARTSYRRLSLSNWITDVEQGAGHLLARVIVNRLWQHHIGRGIVNTPSDFGVQGEKPSHPELLDYLATELIQNGWKLKHIHRLIMNSAVYTQSAVYDEARAKVDPDNVLNWRRSVRRLEGEVIRDSILSVSGTLDATMFGPGSLDQGHKRRSIYFTIKRSKLIPILTLFDGPDTLQSLGRRATTTIAPQAMAMMNNPHIRAASHAFGKRLMPQAASSLSDAVKSGYYAALGREPDGEELETSVAFLKEQSEAYKNAGKQNGQELALANFCQALISLNEFIYVE